MKSIADEWKRLSNNEKVVFEEHAAELNREYKLKLKIWEDEMVKTGRWYLLAPSKQLNLCTCDEYLQKSNAAVSLFIFYRVKEMLKKSPMQEC